MEELYYCALRLAKTLDIFLISVFLSWVYTVQRFSDDIHFNFGRQPTKYWKVCWYFMPVIVGVSYWNCINSVLCSLFLDNKRLLYFWKSIQGEA